MTALQEVLATVVNSDLSIEILEATFNDLMVNHGIDEQEIIDTLEMNLNDWDK